MALDLTMLQNLGFPEVLLWLLTFAIVYGVLSQFQGGIPKSSAARGIIAIVSGFLVMFAVPATMISVLSEMIGGLILFVLAILVIIIFIEVAGIQTLVRTQEKDEKGNIKEKVTPVPIFVKYGKYFAIVFIIIAILLFVSAGGLDLLGWNIEIGQTSTMTLVFLAIIILAVFWLIANPA